VLLGWFQAVRPQPRPRDIGILLPNNQRQHRTLHIQKVNKEVCLWQLSLLPGAALEFPASISKETRAR